jgi:Ni,Fe-hydrogenase III large subunit
VHYVEVGEDGRIARYKVRTASFMNWPLVPVATVNGNIIADAPLVNKSFNLCYACVDR